MKDDLKYREIFQNTGKIIPTIPLLEILHIFMGMDIDICSAYPEKVCPNYFWKISAPKYPTYLQFGHKSKILQLFDGSPHVICEQPHRKSMATYEKPLKKSNLIYEQPLKKSSVIYEKTNKKNNSIYDLNNPLDK